MVAVFSSLTVILLVATLAPFLASLVPGRAVPEVVFLVFAGALLGPSGARLISVDSAPIQLISDLGMGFLFLMAGYEMDLHDLAGRTGRAAALSWLVSLGLGFAVVTLCSARLGFAPSSWPTLAILMTTTAYGTLAPIMRDRGLGGTRVGHIVTVYGSLGELLPIFAMTFMLSSRPLWATAVSAVVFVLVAALALFFSTRLRSLGTRFWHFMNENSEGSSFPLVRLVATILVLLLLDSALFDFDGVLGAFTAGFILRALFPEGNELLERNLRVLGGGFFQPIFFVASGASIDLMAAAANLPLLVGFIASLVVVRGLVVALALNVDGETRVMSWQEKFSASAYCTMALPLVVAITSVALDAGLLGADAASVLVMAAALTVLFIPIVTAVVRVAGAAAAAEALEELVVRHEDPRAILREHRLAFNERQEQFRRRLIQAHERGERMGATEYLARGGYHASGAQAHSTQGDAAATPGEPPTRPGDATRQDPPL